MKYLASILEVPVNPNTFTNKIEQMMMIMIMAMILHEDNNYIAGVNSS